MFAIALLGNADTNMQTQRMKLIIPHNSEPDWGEEDQLNEEPIDMDIGACIAGLTEGLNYVILKFEDLSLVPDKDFVESMGWTKSWQFVAESSTWEMMNFDRIRSDQSIFYRVV